MPDNSCLRNLQVKAQRPFPWLPVLQLVVLFPLLPAPLERALLLDWVLLPVERPCCEHRLLVLQPGQVGWHVITTVLAVKLPWTMSCMCRYAMPFPTPSSTCKTASCSQFHTRHLLWSRVMVQEQLLFDNSSAAESSDVRAHTSTTAGLQRC
jgi:hypothetical protein